MSPVPYTTVTHLECSLCSRKFEPGKVYNLCDCGGPLLVRYDLEKLRRSFWPKQHVALSPGSASDTRNFYYLTGRRHDAADSYPAPWAKNRRRSTLVEG